MAGDSNDPPFKIDPLVAALTAKGQEDRWIASEISCVLEGVIEDLLGQFPNKHKAVAAALEHASQQLNSRHEQNIRLEREARQIREARSGSNGVVKRDISNGLAAVPGDKPKTGGTP